MAIITSAVPKDVLLAIFSGVATGLSDTCLEPFIRNMHSALWVLAATSVSARSSRSCAPPPRARPPRRSRPDAASAGRPPDGVRSAQLSELSLSLPSAPSSGGTARAAIRERFGAALGRTAFADLELVVSELVSNAVEHGRGAVRVEVSHTRGEIRGSVSDAGGGFDYALRAITGSERRGRGLAIVDALVTHWGIRHGSTQVWFVMRLAS